MKKLKITVEWDGKTYTREEIIDGSGNDVNPGDKTLPLMGETLEKQMIDILHEIVTP